MTGIPAHANQSSYLINWNILSICPSQNNTCDRCCYSSYYLYVTRHLFVYDLSLESGGKFAGFEVCRYFCHPQPDSVDEAIGLTALDFTLHRPSSVSHDLALCQSFPKRVVVSYFPLVAHRWYAVRLMSCRAGSSVPVQHFTTHSSRLGYLLRSHS